MPRPTKFDLMRDRRWAADIRIAAEQQGLKLVTYREAKSAIPPSLAELRQQFGGVMELSASAVESAVQTMEIDGIQYREAPELTWGSCGGCALKAGCSSWRTHSTAATAAFGGDCSDREVIYLKVE